MKREYLRTDKNGSRHYKVRAVCQKCGGTGEESYQGVACKCFHCEGKGYIEKIEVVRTPEYQAQLDARKLKKEKEHEEYVKSQASEINERFFKKRGMNKDGVGFVVVGDTFSLKDDLKKSKAKYIGGGWWVFSEKPTNYETVRIDASKVLAKNELGIYQMDWLKLNEYITEKMNTAKPEKESESSYIGNVGETIERAVTYLRSHSFTSTFGLQYFHVFETKDKDVLVWRTTTYPSGIKRWKRITGEVKEHRIFKKEAQTIIVKAKVIEVEKEKQ